MQRKHAKRFSTVAGLPLLLLGLAPGVLVAFQAHAQLLQTPLLDGFINPLGVAGGSPVQPGVTVISRPRPEYDSSGVQVGNFVIRPELDESTGYDSNVLGTPAPHGSALIETNASLAASSDWSESSIRAAVSVDDHRYPSQPAQSYTNWSASLGGQYEFGRDIASGFYSHQALNQTPGSLDVPQLTAPLPYTVDSVQLGYRINFSSLFLTPGLEVDSYNYANGTVNGTEYLQSFRDRVVVMPSLTAGYELAPQRDLVLVIRDAIASYSNQTAGFASHNYNDLSVLGGFDYTGNGIVRYRALVGYETRQFQSPQYKGIQAPIVEASVIWTPTELTTVTGTAARQIEDSSDETTAGYTETYAQLRVDHEYLPNVLLRADAGAYFTNYGGGGGSQQFYTVGAGVTYLMNRNMQLQAGYDFSARQSGSGGNLGLFGQPFGSSYTDHLITLQLRLRL